MLLYDQVHYITEITATVWCTLGTSLDPQRITGQMEGGTLVYTKLPQGPPMLTLFFALIKLTQNKANGFVPKKKKKKESRKNILSNTT